MTGEFHSNVTTFLYLSIFPCFGTAVEKKIKDQTGKYLHGRFIQGHSTCILDWFTPESLKKKIRIRCYWWQVSATTKNKTFPTPMLTALLVWCCFSCPRRNQRHLQKKKKKQPWSTLQGFSYRKQIWMLHSNNNKLLQSSNYQAFCVRKYSSSNLIHYDG